MNPLVRPLGYWKGRDGRLAVLLCVGNCAARFTLCNVLFDVVDHVRPPHQFLEAFRCAEDAAVPTNLGVVGLPDGVQAGGLGEE